jgi:hypothetical protein
VATGLVSEQVLFQTKGFLRAVGNLTNELLIVYPLVVLVEHILSLEFLVA